MKRMLLHLMTVLVFWLTAVSVDISAYAAEICVQDNIKYAYENQILTISGNGEIGEAPFSEFKDSLETIVIEDGITGISADAFRGYRNVKNVVLPQSLESIGECGFAECSSLENIAVPSKITKICDGTFLSCENLFDVSLPDGILSIGGSAFKNCKKLGYVKIPRSCMYIGDYAFCTCISLENVAFSDNLIGIGASAFHSCILLKSIIVPRSVTTIGARAFADCDSLLSAVFDDGLSYISPFAFYSCEKLKCVTIPASVLYIGRLALGYINYGGYVASDSDFMIHGNNGTAAETYAINNEIMFNGERISGNDGTMSASADVSEDYEVLICEAAGVQCQFRISDREKKTVQYAGYTGADVTTVIIPSTVRFKGITYKVAGIANDAFRNDTMIEKVLIGSNVTDIEDHVFQGCKNLKKIIIDSSKLLSVGNNALKNTPVNLVIKVPSNKMKFYRKLFMNKGNREVRVES